MNKEVNIYSFNDECYVYLNDYKKLQQENKALKEKINGVYEERDYLYNKTTIESKYIIQQLKDRIDKALSFIINNFEFDNDVEDLLEILKGDDNNER